MSEVNPGDVAAAVASLEGGKVDGGEAPKVDMKAEAVAFLNGEEPKAEAPEDESADDAEDDFEEEEAGEEEGAEEEENAEEESEEDGADGEESEESEPDEDHGQKVKKGKARKMRERAQAAEAKVSQYEEHLPQLIENAEWFMQEYTKASETLQDLQAENKRLAARLEYFEIPEYDSEAERVAYESQAELARYRERDLRREQAEKHAKARQQAQELAPIAEEIKALAARSGLSAVDIVEAYAFRARRDPSVQVKDVVRNLVAASGKSQRVASAKRQAKKSGRSPGRPKGGSAGVSDLKTYPNTVDGAVAFLNDRNGN